MGIFDTLKSTKKERWFKTPDGHRIGHRVITTTGDTITDKTEYVNYDPDLAARIEAQTGKKLPTGRTATKGRRKK